MNDSKSQLRSITREIIQDSTILYENHIALTHNLINNYKNLAMKACLLFIMSIVTLALTIMSLLQYLRFYLQESLEFDGGLAQLIITFSVTLIWILTSYIAVKIFAQLNEFPRRIIEPWKQQWSWFRSLKKIHKDL